MATEPLDLAKGKRLLSEALPAPWVASRPFYSNRDLDAVAWLRNNADALLAAAERDEEHANCYCACHSRVSSCPMCPHCEGAVRVMEAALLRERRVAAEEAEKLREAAIGYLERWRQSKLHARDVHGCKGGVPGEDTLSWIDAELAAHRAALTPLADVLKEPV